MDNGWVRLEEVEVHNEKHNKGFMTTAVGRLDSKDGEWKWDLVKVLYIVYRVGILLVGGGGDGKVCGASCRDVISTRLYELKGKVR